MNIAVIGKNGQLAQCLAVTLTDVEVQFFAKETVNIVDFSTYGALDGADLVINCSAYTAVDSAEKHPEDAFEVNRKGVIQLVEYCTKMKKALIHFSTDFVFEGLATQPYSEDDHTGQQSVYGASKLAGEEVILQSSLSALVIRTSWLYSPYGHNFCKTMLRLGAERTELSVVADQIGTPTSALDLARAVSHIIKAGLPSRPELLHVANSGQCSWADLARAIFKEKGMAVTVNSITAAEFGALAPRPAYSVLATEKLLFKYGIAMRPWREALKEILAGL